MGDGVVENQSVKGSTLLIHRGVGWYQSSSGPGIPSLSFSGETNPSIPPGRGPGGHLLKKGHVGK